MLRLAALPQSGPFLALRKGGLPGSVLDVLLADADADADTGAETLGELGRNSATPWRIRRELAQRSQDTLLRAAVAQSRCAEDDPGARGEWIGLLRTLAADGEPAVRAAVARNALIPRDLAESLAGDSEAVVRRAVAGQHYRPELAVAWRGLLTDPDSQVRNTAAANHSHPPIPEDLADGLLLEPDTRLSALLNGSAVVSHEAGAAIAIDPEPFVRMTLAAHRRLPGSLVSLLAQDEATAVRAMLATRGDIPAALRDELIANLPLEDDDLHYLELDTLLNALRSPGRKWNGAPISAEAARACLASGQRFLRHVVAVAAPLSLEELAALFDDTDAQVASAAAWRHPNPPGEVLERLATHPTNAWPAGGLHHHPAFPPDAWARLAAHEQTWLRVEACKYAQLPAEIVGPLARDPEPQVREAAAGHPNLPTYLIPALLADPAGKVAERMGASPALTVDWLYRLLDESGY